MPVKIGNCMCVTGICPQAWTLNGGLVSGVFQWGRKYTESGNDDGHNCCSLLKYAWLCILNGCVVEALISSSHVCLYMFYVQGTVHKTLYKVVLHK